MRRENGQSGSYSSFIPKISINRSSDFSHDRSNSEYFSNEKRVPPPSSPSTSFKYEVNEQRRQSQWCSNLNNESGFNNNNSNNNNNNTNNSTNNNYSYSNNDNSYDINGPNQNSPIPRNNNNNNNNNNEFSRFINAHIAQDAKRQVNSSQAPIQRMLRHDAEIYAMQERPASSLENNSSISSTNTSGGSASSDEESTLFDIDAEPVVPIEVLRHSQFQSFTWARHPRHQIILSLLRSRGIFFPRYTELIEYHMSELFLHYIELCCNGAYFIRYQNKSNPRERFCSIRMLPREMTKRGSEQIPYLVWTIHKTGVQVVGCIPLEQFVGITINTRSIAFRTHLTSMKTIKGPRVGSRRIEVPTDGGFSLWFYDRRQRLAKSVDLLTCNPTVFDVWTKTFKGLVSVNSASVVQIPLTQEGVSVELEELTREAQQQVTINAQ